MRNRHMLALLLGVVPIVIGGQLVTAQPMNHSAMNSSMMNNSMMNHSMMNHHGMDHSMMNRTMPAGNVSNAAPAPDNSTDLTTPPLESTPEPGNMGDDQPPQ